MYIIFDGLSINIYIQTIANQQEMYLGPNNGNDNKGTNKEALVSMYRSGVRASYFGQMAQPKMMQKSRLQISNIQEHAQQQIDEATFRLLPNFKRPQANFQVHKKSGQCFIDKPPLFSCLSQRKPCRIELSNSRLSIINRGEIVRFVDFSAVSADVVGQGKYFVIRFEQSERELYIEPTQAGQVEKWVSKLNEIIKSTDGKPKGYTYLARKSPQFYKYEHLLNQEFEKQANSGDILLFRSPHSAATAQRLFTNSQYDHVGLVLRNKKAQIFIYESTSAEGVGLTPWKHMIKYQWYNYTEKIAWRKLNAEIGPLQIQIIEAFVAKTLGKGFQINLDKLFKFKSTLKRAPEDEQNKSYFCSQLVARLYKQLGYFDSQKSSTTYYPVDFSQKTSLKFTKPGVSLSNQRIISFDS